MTNSPDKSNFGHGEDVGTQEPSLIHKVSSFNLQARSFTRRADYTEGFTLPLTGFPQPSHLKGLRPGLVLPIRSLQWHLKMLFVYSWRWYSVGHYVMLVYAGRVIVVAVVLLLFVIMANKPTFQQYSVSTNSWQLSLPLAVLRSATAQSVWILQSSRPGSVFLVQAEAVHPGQEGTLPPAAAQVGAAIRREKRRTAAHSWSGWKAKLWKKVCILLSSFTLTEVLLYLVCWYRPLSVNGGTTVLFHGKN